MRDKLISDLDYYTKFIDLQKSLLSQSYDRLNNNQIEEDNIPTIKHRLFFKKLEILIASYGRGDSVSDLQNHLSVIFDCIQEEWEDKASKFKKGRPQVVYDQYWLNSYCYMIWFLSISILLGINTQQVKILTEIIEKGKIKDELILLLLSELNGKTYAESKKTTYKPFNKFVKSELSDIDGSALKKYLKSWHNGTKLMTWHSYIKSAPDKQFYFGYWSFETSALVAILNIDDTTFKEHPNYPEELVAEYRRRKSG